VEGKGLDNYMQDKRRIETIAGLAVIAFLFIGMSFLSQLYGDEILKFALAEYNFSKALYVLMIIFAIVVAPFSTVPLIPLASHLWGWTIAGMLSIVGWVIGAQIAFILARWFGKPFVERIFPLKKLHTFENNFSDKNLFWTVALLRIIVPVDILSYAIGLFSEMNSTPFFFATLIGVTPFAFIFAYAGTLPVRLQLLVLIGMIAFLGIVFIVRNVVQGRKK